MEMREVSPMTGLLPDEQCREVSLHKSEAIVVGSQALHGKYDESHSTVVAADVDRDRHPGGPPTRNEQGVRLSRGANALWSTPAARVTEPALTTSFQPVETGSGLPVG